MDFYGSAFNTRFKAAVSAEKAADSFPSNWLLRYFITHHTLVSLEATALTVPLRGVVPGGC